MSLRFTHVTACVGISFLFKLSNIPWHIWIIPHFFSIYINGHLGSLHLLPIINNAAVTLSLPKSLQDPAFNYFGHISRSGIAGSCDNTICNFFRNHHTAFRSHWTILHSHQQSARVPISPHSLTFLLFSVFFSPWLMFLFLFSDSRYSNGCEVLFHCGFDFHSPND